MLWEKQSLRALVRNKKFHVGGGSSYWSLMVDIKHEAFHPDGRIAC